MEKRDEVLKARVHVRGVCLGLWGVCLKESERVTKEEGLKPIANKENFQMEKKLFANNFQSESQPVSE